MAEQNHTGASFRYIAGSHLFAASHFSKLSGEIERAKQSPQETVNYHESTRNHVSYVPGAIMSSVAFLEATINELFSTATDSSFGVGLPAEYTKRLAAVWKLEHIRQRVSIIEKYQLALELCDELLFESGLQPFQDTKLLIQLRNALVHYVPEPVVTAPLPSGDIPLQALERKLRGKFALSPFALTMTIGIGKVGEAPELTRHKAVFFPDLCLGHGCAKWAVNTSLKFADEFCSTLGWEPPYAYVRSNVDAK